MAEPAQRDLFGTNRRHLLSATSLGLFSECPRCFWLERIRGLKRPQGPFPSLPGGMDLVIKTYFDLYRGQNRLPPELEGKLPGRLLPDQELLNRWRRWTGPSNKTTGGLWYRDKNLGADLVGLLDDCLVDGETYIPLDYKTRGYPPKESTSKYYQTQLDLYTLLLAENGYKTDRVAYLVYYWPRGITQERQVLFEVEPQRISTDSDRGLQIFQRAARLLQQGNPPSRPPDCAFCQWSEQTR